MAATEIRTIVITGANSGIGLATAEALAGRGHHVVMVCRNRQKAEAARLAIVQQIPPARVDLLCADLSLLADVRRVATEIQNRFPDADTLINNAGIFLGQRTVSGEGLETTWTVNHLAPLLLSLLLKEQLTAGGKGRIITLSSWGHNFGDMDFANLQGERRYGAMNAYGRAKLASIMTVYKLAELWAGNGIKVNAVHPGAIGSNFAQSGGGWMQPLMILGKPFLSSSKRGADTPVWLATEDWEKIPNGAYIIRRKPHHSSALSRRQEVAHQLWNQSLQMIGM